MPWETPKYIEAVAGTDLLLALAWRPARLNMALAVLDKLRVHELVMWSENELPKIRLHWSRAASLVRWGCQTNQQLTSRPRVLDVMIGWNGALESL